MNMITFISASRLYFSLFLSTIFLYIVVVVDETVYIHNQQMAEVTQ
jgi:hypothetical protein